MNTTVAADRNKTTSKKSRARILIVDDHPAVREGLSLRIAAQPDMEVCGEAADVAEALRLVVAAKPNAAIVDIALKTGNGIDLIKRIKSRDDSIRILVCSMYGETVYADRALRAGAQGYITKEHATDKILGAIRQVLAGKIYLSEAMSQQLLHGALGHRNHSTGRAPIEKLSDRELEAFQLFGEALETHQIAQRMRVSHKTVETYRARIKQKLGLSTHNELIRQAVQWAAAQGAK
jgi:DNA-binding NarL/FixJ family response regulator